MRNLANHPSPIVEMGHSGTDALKTSLTFGTGSLTYLHREHPYPKVDTQPLKARIFRSSANEKESSSFLYESARFCLLA